MRIKSQWKELFGQFQFFTFSAIASLVDTAFLVLWVLLQWLIDVKVLNNYQLTGIDSWVLVAFQVMFAVSTLVPIAIFYYGDIRVMYLRTKRRIDSEINLIERNRGTRK